MEATNSSLSELRNLTNQITLLFNELNSDTTKFSSENKELLGYIKSSIYDIINALNVASEVSLKETKFRHDLRNMIGSISGFSELLSMEQAISDDSNRKFSQLVKLSNDFVKILEYQKTLIS